MPGVEGRVVVVTGSGGGIGRQHALLFAERGAKVVINDLGGSRDGSGGGSEMADNVVKEITDAGGEAVANYDNVATAEGGEGVIKTALDAFGKVTFAKMEHAQWDAVLKVHLYGTYYVTRAAWPHLREQSYGRVIVTSSTSGIYGNFGQSNYGAAKLGVVGLINTLAMEGKKYNITANAIAPIALTRMTEDIFPEEFADKFDPAYISPAVVHLGSEECTDTGSIILAGGGNYARVAYFQAPGATFEAVPTVDELAARWDEVLDLSNANLGQPFGG
jgi:NAD(P)-dependent dehydrogenase (short-subunit alcohol dehydrogenase family)